MGWKIMVNSNIIPFPVKPRIQLPYTQLLIDDELFVKQDLRYEYTHAETKIVFKWGLGLGTIGGVMLGTILAILHFAH